MKKWRVASGGLESFDSLEKLEVFLCKLRGVSRKGRKEFFEPQYARDIHNPHELYSMEEAVGRVYRAVKKDERILVYGDYDADGVSATAIMVTVLEDIGANVSPYLPDRSDGYGINKDVLSGIIDDFDLLITVDCGVSNAKEVAWLKKCGKDVIITDHHEFPSKLPNALALLHPRHPKGKYPWKYLAGAGVAWKFAQAILRHDDSPFVDDVDREKWLLDLALLGTVGDIMPLVQENRTMVRFGLEVLRRTKRPGLREIMKRARLDVGGITVEDVSFRIVPLLNAAGRVGHPQSALNVLLSRDAKKASVLVDELVALNQQRQAETRRVLREAEKCVEVSSPVVFVANVDWPAGIVGLVANNLASKHEKLAVVVGGNGKHAVGSARGSGSVNVLEVLRCGQEHVMRLGGHAGAAGFSVQEKNIFQLQKAVEGYFADEKNVISEDDVRSADAVLDSSLLDWGTVDLLDRFELCGESNPKPMFVFRNLPVLHHGTVGKNDKHLKMRFSMDSGELDGIGFGLAEMASGISDMVDVLGHLEVNAFNGSARLQLRIEDIVSSGKVEIVT